MRKLLFVFFFLSSFIVMGHKGVITGIVKDQSSGEPISGATVSIKGISKGTLTNEFGQFRLSEISEGKWQLLISSVGYETTEQEITIGHDEVVRLQVVLNKSVLQLNEVHISSLKPHDQQLISRFDIQARPINNSQDVLRLVPGLLMGQHAGGGKAEQIFLRGFDIDHGTDIQLTADGMPVNMVSHAHGQGYSDLHFIIPELIDEVEFKKGLYHASKGNFSTAGWVNFKTRNTLDRNIVKVEGGQFNTYRVMTAVNLLKSDVQKQSAYLAGEYNYSDSYFDHSQNFNRMNLFGKYHAHLGRTAVNLSASTFWSKWNHSGQIPDRAVADGSIGFFGAIDPTEGGETSRTNVNAEFSTVTARNQIWKNQFFYTNYNFELYSNFTFFLENEEFGDQIKQKENRHLWGYNGSYNWAHALGKNDAEFTLGLNYRHDLTNDSELSNTFDRTQILERISFGDINEANIGIYADESFELSQRLKMNVGVRYDHFFNRYLNYLDNKGWEKANAGILSPKFNVYYTLNPKWQFYLNSGKGFHSNDTRVVVPSGGKEILPAAYGTDLGFTTKLTPRLLLNAAYWYLHMNQEFVYVGDAGVVEPSGKSRRQGVDVSARYQILPQLFFDVDANWAVPRAIDEAKGEDYIPLAPKFTSMGGFTLKKDLGFNGSWRYRYVADRAANEDNSVIAKGYFVSDVQLNYTQKRYQLGLMIQNLFNTRWKETQFNTESRLKNEFEPVEEIHFTPGTPFQAKLILSIFF